MIISSSLSISFIPLVPLLALDTAFGDAVGDLFTGDQIEEDYQLKIVNFLYTAYSSFSP